MSTRGFCISRAAFSLIFGVLISFLCLCFCARPALADVIEIGPATRGSVGSSIPSFSDMDALESVSFAFSYGTAGHDTNAWKENSSSFAQGPYSMLQVPVSFSGTQYVCFGYGSDDDYIPIAAAGDKITVEGFGHLLRLYDYKSGVLIGSDVVEVDEDYGFRTWVSYDNETWTQVKLNGDSVVELGRPIFAICVACRGYFSSVKPVDSISKMYVGLTTVPRFFRIVDDGTGEVVGAIEDQTTSVEQEMEETADKLLSTDGSDSILSGELTGGEDGILDRLGFVGTVVQVPASIFEGLTSAEDSSVDFPGVSVALPGGDFTIPSYSIDLWENFPALETPVRTGCTFVVVLLWLRGCKSIYERIVHGSTMVETE